MTELEELENAIRAEADRKIRAGRELSDAAASVREALGRYRLCFGEAVAAGFTEADLKRHGLTVDGVQPAPSRTRPKALGGQKGRSRTRPAGAGVPAVAPTGAEETAGAAAREGAALSA